MLALNSLYRLIAFLSYAPHVPFCNGRYVLISISVSRAAVNGHLPILRVLSAYGGEMGTVANDGDTPIHLAATQGYGPICKFLAQRGTNSQIFFEILIFFLFKAVEQ